ILTADTKIKPKKEAGLIFFAVSVGELRSTVRWRAVRRRSDNGRSFPAPRTRTGSKAPARARRSERRRAAAKPRDPHALRGFCLPRLAPAAGRAAIGGRRRPSGVFPG